MDKNSLMASLMTDGAEQDLFGDVPLDDPLVQGPPEPLSVSVSVSVSDPIPLSVPPQVSDYDPKTLIVQATTNVYDTVQPPTASATAPPPQQPPGPSLLAQSGLLCLQEQDGDGGLFADVDEEEMKKKQEEINQQQEHEQQQQQLLQQQQQQQQRLQQQQQQQQQQQLTSSYHSLQQQQQLQLQQQLQNQQSHTVYQQPLPVNTPSAPIIPPQQQHHLQQQSQLQAGMQNMSLQPSNQGFYREHPPAFILTGPPPPSNAYSGSAVPPSTPGPSANYYYGTQQPSGMPQPNITAGLHNAVSTNPIAPGHLPMSTSMHMHMQNQSPHRPISQPKLGKITLVKPPEVPPLYTQIQVSEPMLIQQQNFLISSAPYWSYQVSTQLAPPQQGTWLVRRRFRHVVALEDRLRQTCPGSILPPRPDKHATRALEEASTQQSAEFAIQRARELAQYLNALAKHPVAGQSQVLRLFLGLQDDIGTAWPEVSGNAFTKLGAVAAGMSMKVAETTQLTAASAPAHEWEDDAELLALGSSENLRMGAVSQAVPKLEGTVTNLREHGDAAGAVGMELSKVAKMPANEDFKVCDVLSNGLLRQGRRNKRLAVELSAAMDSFLQQYKMVRYEKMALQDRRQAIQRKGTYRRGADQRAMYLAQQQRHLQASGQFGHLNQLERSAIQTDSMANEVVGEAEEIAARLKSEIHRVAIERRTQWNASMKTIASAMKEACAERLAIWESTLEALKGLPGGMPTDDSAMFNGGAGIVPSSLPGNMASSHIDGSAMYRQQGMNVSPPLNQNQSQNQQLDTSTIYA